MTPSDIEVLLHCHCCISQHPRNDAPAVRDSISMFMKEGIIEPHTNADERQIYRTTLRGQALVALLCATPYPDEKWVDPRDNKVIGE